MMILLRCLALQYEDMVVVVGRCIMVILVLVVRRGVMVVEVVVGSLMAQDTVVHASQQLGTLLHPGVHCRPVRRVGIPSEPS